MYPVSGAFKSAVRTSHTAIIRCEVWRGDTKVLDLEPLAGTVDIDSRRSIRRTLTLEVAAPRPTEVTAYDAATYNSVAGDYGDFDTLAASVASYGTLSVVGDVVIATVDPGIVPDDAFDSLAPFGNEIRVWRGIRVVQESAASYGDLASQTFSNLASNNASYGILALAEVSAIVDELVPLGVFLITDVEIRDGDRGITVAIAGSDRSLRVARSRWTSAYAIASGTNTSTAISNLLSDRYGDVITSFSSTTDTVAAATLGTEPDNDPWRDALKLATSSGMELFFDGDGTAILQPGRDYADASPDAVYEENEEAVVLSVLRRLSNSQTYNGVIVTAEGTDTTDTFRAEAWDEDPASPTYRYGSFGEAPLFFSSPLIRTQEQAQTAAETTLSRIKGATESVEWTQITDPSLDVGDVIALTNTGTKVARLMVLDRISIPLDPSQPMSAVSRTIRSLNGETYIESGE